MNFLKKMINKCSFGLISETKSNTNNIESIEQKLLLKNQRLSTIEQKLSTVEQQLLAVERNLENTNKSCLKKIHLLKQSHLIEKLKNKNKLKVVFLAIHKSVWKVDQVFKKMLDDPYFEPLILVCPYTLYGEERMWEDMRDTYEYFEQKGYPLISSFISDENRWLSLNELDIDIVFFTNPHELTRKEYYQDAYMNYLSCYVPYYTDMASGYSLESSYDQIFHNLVWRIFMDSEYSYNRAIKFSKEKRYNLTISGNLIQEQLLNTKTEKIKNLWKAQKSDKKKIIYAPHQSITHENNLHLGTFLKNGEFIRSLAVKYKDEVQWSFKPHPLLKTKLNSHPDWGKTRTDQYYAFWEQSEYTQLDDGEYIELFLTSDAIIHDSASFIFEYLLMEKPSGYLHFNGDDQLKAINQYGLDLIKKYTVLNNTGDIEHFIKNVINNSAHVEKFKEHYDSPSDFILNNLKKALMK